MKLEVFRLNDRGLADLRALLKDLEPDDIVHIQFLSEGPDFNPLAYVLLR